MQINFLKFEFRFTLLGLGLYLLLLALLISLGFWQLGRSEQKRQFLAQQAMASTAAELDLNREAIDMETDRYRNVRVTGHYDTAHQFLIDNQIMDGKPGYLVLTPFLIDQENQAVLVNRGWLPLGSDRNQRPDISISTPVNSINGRLNHFPSVGIKLKGAEIPTESWPALVQIVDSSVLAARVGYALKDYQIELNSEAIEGYRRDWKINTAIITPEKHLAYAVQWFGLALTLTGLFIWISTRKRSEPTT